MKKLFTKYIEKKLAIWARRVVRRNETQIIGVTGSVGKTMTKEAIYAVLATKFGKEVGRSHGNLNTELGLPLTILGFKSAPQGWLNWLAILLPAWWRSLTRCGLPNYLILEMAADKPGDIDYLLTIVQPKIGVVTTVGASHLAQFKSIDGVAKEKSRLVEALPEDGIAFLNKADVRVVEMAKLVKGKVVYFEAATENLAVEAASAVGKYFGISDEKIKEGLESREGLPGRMTLIGGINGAIVIDDCYNANPVSMMAALRNLEKLASEKMSKRKIAVLGDMLDLGEYTTQAHREVMNLARANADFVVGIGEAMKVEKPGNWFADADAAGNWLLKEIKEGDIILIKGSHGMHLEKIVNKITRER